MRSSLPSSISPAHRQQLQISAALSRERLMDVHFRYVMELVEHARQELDPGRAIAIYTRLHNLREPDATSLHQKVFVALGRRTPANPFARGKPEEAPGWESPQTTMALIRRRLRGRVNTELREWVEYHTGRAETELLYAHVENSLRFVDILHPEIGIGDAVALYAEEMTIPRARVEILYYLVLAHRSAETLPPTTQHVVEPGQPPRAIPDTRRVALRVVERQRNPRTRNTG